MIDLKPQLSTYARVSYGWELQGSPSNAIRAMELARHAAASPADTAWAANQLGDLHWNSGRPADAEGWYRRAIAADPSFIPPHAGLARVEAARGQTNRAIDNLEWVIARYPSPEYVIALGDLYTVNRRPEEAARQYALVRAEERLLRAGGVNVDLEIALFDADHGVELANGLAAARMEWSRRRSIDVADALAWELYANGRHAEALRYANQALRLGTRNALFYFHRGMIERALGKRRAARRDLAAALETNPHFSILWSERASQVLASLGGDR
jgi:tetratricopeptide (TPR) repeat protein